MDPQKDSKTFNKKIVVGVNLIPLSKDGGGMKQHFIDTFINIIKLKPWDKYGFVFFYFEKAFEVISEIDGLFDEIKKGNIKLCKIDFDYEIWNKRDLFDLYLCPLNNINPKISTKPSISILADIQDQYMPQFFSKQDRYARAYVYPDIAESCSKLITISEFSKNTFIEKFKTNPDKIRVIYPSISNKFKELIKQNFKLNFNLPKNFFLYPANSYPHKNHKMLFEAFKILKQRGYTGYKLVLTGNTKFGGNDLSKVIRQMGLDDLILDLGYQKYEQLLEILKRVNAIIFPSLFEGFGIPLIEASYINKPFLCSDNPCLKEIGQDGVYYFNEKNPESIAKCIIDFEEGKLLNLDKEREIINSVFDSNTNASKLLHEISLTYNEFYKKSYDKNRRLDIYILSFPYCKDKIESTIASINNIGIQVKYHLLSNNTDKLLNVEDQIRLSNLKDAISVYDKYSTLQRSILLFAGVKVNSNLLVCEDNVMYMPVVTDDQKIRSISGKDYYYRYVNNSDVLKRQFIKYLVKDIEFNSSKSFVLFEIKDYIDYLNSDFDKDILKSNGLALKLYLYLFRRNKLVFLKPIKFIYNTLSNIIKIILRK